MLFSHYLEERCFVLAKKVRVFCRKLTTDVGNVEDVARLIRISGLIGAYYIRSYDDVQPMDLRRRFTLSRKATKESIHYLKLLDTFDDGQLEAEKTALIKLSAGLVKTFSAMLRKLDEPIGRKSENESLADEAERW